jgi:hypothetical protein
MSKRAYLILLIAIVVVAAAAGIWAYQKRDKTESKSFVGGIEKVEGSTVTLNGFYEVPAAPEKETPDNRVNVDIIITPDTKLTKTLLHYPTPAELEKTGGAYKPSELRQEQVQGSMEDLKSGTVDGFFAYSEKNIYGKKAFEASEIKYMWTVYPAELQQ